MTVIVKLHKKASNAIHVNAVGISLMNIAIPEKLHFVRALRWRLFALLWPGQTVSVLRNGAFSTAQAWEVLLFDARLFYNAQGKYAEAKPLYRRALEISVAALGQEHPVRHIGRPPYISLNRPLISLDSVMSLLVLMHIDRETPKCYTEQNKGAVRDRE